VWERVSCPLCDGDDEELVLTKRSQPDGNVFRLVRCRECGLGYVNPRPSSESIKYFYPEDYHPYQPPTPRKEGAWWRLRQRLEQRALERSHGYPVREPSPWWERLTARLLTPWVGPGRDSLTSLPYRGEGRLLDFGCGSGWFAERMRRRGWRVEGIDFSEHAARQAEQAYGIRVHVGSLPHSDIPGESFDLLNMGSVLEHVHEPHSVIEAAAGALKPGGMLAVSVPNLASWAVERFGANAYSVDLPRHLLFFTPVTLRRLLESHGLRVSRQQMLNRVSWLRRTLRNVRKDETQPGGLRRFARLMGVGPLCGLLSRWTVREGRADLFLTLACKSS
jgi:2-polyprenyl-3-methyl-5-hydroxy-6-metoxy-1,4-benzoquinol methylase